MNDEIIKFSELANFLPKQKEAQEASKRFKFTLYGGSLGSGKSYWLRWMMVYWLIKLHAKTGLKGIRAGLFCEDYPSLEDRHLSKVKYEFPAWLGSYHGSRHEFTLAPEYGGGVIAFRNLDDPEKYLSVEFAVMGVDEINRNTVVTFRELRKRLRWSGVKDVRFLAACNPIGEAWVKNWWVKRMFPPEENEQYEFVFVPALPTDNPYLDASYYKSLESLPESQRKAFLEGNWDAFDEGLDEKGYIRLVSDRELMASYVVGGIHSGFNVLGVDPAAGGDKSAIVLKSANFQEVLFNQKTPDTMDLVGIAADLYRKHKGDYIAIDKTGIGQGVFDRLKQMDFPVKGIMFGEKSEDPMFLNYKAELHWRQRQWMLSGGRLIRNEGWNEFEYVKYKNRDGKILIQPKEDLFREGILSPNCVDAAVLTQCLTDATIRNTRIIKAQGGVFRDKMIEVWRG